MSIVYVGIDLAKNVFAVTTMANRGASGFLSAALRSAISRTFRDRRSL